MLRASYRKLLVGQKVSTVLTRYSGVLPPVSGYSLWVDASYTPSLTFVDGNLSQWDDLSGNGNHFTQSTVARRPTYGRHINGIPTVGFNGDTALQWMESTITSSDNTCSRFIVARNYIVTQQQYLLGSNGGTGGIGLRLAADADMETTTDGVATQFSPTTLDITAEQPYVFGQIIGGGTNIVHRRDGSSDSSAAAISPTASRTTRLGISSANSQPLYGDVAEVLIYTTSLSGGDQDLIMAYLKGKWGTP